MEQVLYNTVAGARPIQPDGISFYYSDYNRSDAKKVWYKDKWPCCSGTFPQLTADYGISAYYPSNDGIYVNLFLPSKVTWKQNNTECTLTQKTNYPAINATQLELALVRPESFTIYVRVPAWADRNTRLSVNGKNVEGEAAPGKFFALTRTWKTGDRVEYEIGMPLRLQAVDAQNPQLVALVRGPVALFAVGNLRASLTEKQLLAAAVAGTSSSDWVVTGDTSKVTFRPFAAIGDEPYQLYQNIKS